MEKELVEELVVLRICNGKLFFQDIFKWIEYNEVNNASEPSTFRYKSVADFQLLHLLVTEISRCEGESLAQI